MMPSAHSHPIHCPLAYSLAAAIEALSGLLAELEHLMSAMSLAGRGSRNQTPPENKRKVSRTNVGCLVKRCLFLALAVLALGGVASAQQADPTLLTQYKQLNRRYFSGKLPIANVSVFWDETISKSDLAGTWITKFEGEPENIRVSVSTFIQECSSCVGAALLHEMVHIKLRNRKIDMHGKEFQKEMVRLAKKGAFAPYW
jgi:SprT-like family